jgi:hypothetical protein
MKLPPEKTELTFVRSLYAKRDNKSISSECAYIITALGEEIKIQKG